MILRELGIVYPQRVRRSVGTMRRTHLVVTERWQDAGGKHRLVQRKALCGVGAARYLENSDTPVSCPVCRRMAKAAGLEVAA